MDEAADLGALMARVLPALAALEEPILRKAGISMWEYAIASELARNDGVSQAELSRRTRRDPTRLGRHLDDLSARGLVARSRGRDQRQLAVTLTPAGRELLDAVRNEIRGREDEFLAAVLSPLEAVELRRLLAILASAPDASA